jgi:phage shock protein E
MGLLAGVAGCANSSAPSGEAKAEEAKPAEAKAGEEAEPAEAAALADRDPELACRLVREEGAVLLDVRTPEEFAEGHVEGAVNIPHDQIDAQAAEIDALQGGDKGKPIVVYCRSGKRAGVAKQSLIDGGRTQVTNLGGLSDWPECPS